MKFIKLECPNCGGKLNVDQSAERAKCTHCDYDFIIDKEQQEIHYHYYNTQNVRPNNTQSTTSKTYQKPQAKAGTPYTIIVIVFLLVMGLPVITAILGNRSMNKPSLAVVEVRKTPESEPMVTFVEYLFKKPVASISPEEFASIKYIKLEYEDEGVIDYAWHIRYSFEDYASTVNFEDTVMLVSINTDELIDKRDLQVFTGLTALHCPRSNDLSNSYDSVSFKHIKNLTAYSHSFNESLSNATEKSLPNVENITQLATQLRDQNDIDALLKFTNLTDLNISYANEDIPNLNQLSALSKLDTITLKSCDDISWLSVLTNLTTLNIDCYKLSDYKVLYGMPKIEEININSASGIKSLEFVKNMPNLKSLAIHNSEILNIDPLKDNKGLQFLDLEGNSDLTDFLALSTLTSLKELRILNYNNRVPDLSNLKQLESLAIYPTELSATKELIGLKTLYIRGSSDFYAERLASFKNLESLQLKGMTIEGVLELNKLKNLKNLELINMRISYKEENISIFQLENIESLKITDSTSIYIDDISAQIGKRNDTMKELYVECKLADSSKNYDDIPFDKFKQINEFLPSLEVLSVRGQKISNLDFVQNMPHLRMLDVRNNYIVDITPLLSLEDLEELWLTDNDATNIDLMDSEIAILK